MKNSFWLLSEVEKKIIYAQGITNIDQDLGHSIYCAKQLLINNDLRSGRTLYDIVNFIYQCIPESVCIGKGVALFLSLIQEIDEEDVPDGKVLIHYLLLLVSGQFSPIIDERT